MSGALKIPSDSIGEGQKGTSEGDGTENVMTERPSRARSLFSVLQRTFMGGAAGGL